LAGAISSLRLKLAWGTILWRFRDQFLNVPGQDYWLKDVPNEEMGYYPQMGE
jgi:hypothetical protein